MFSNHWKKVPNIGRNFSNGWKVESKKRGKDLLAAQRLI